MWYCSGVIPDIHIAIGDTVLGKYRVERILGKGGMGMVIAARHLELEELFAIKFMLPGTAESPDAAARFLREARAAAKLKGDHVAKVHDVGRMEDGSYYMVMEYLEGSDLGKIVGTQGPLPVEEAIRYVLEACETLKEAHALGIIHRDIKPSNIFLARGPQGTPRVKVIDFGISKCAAGDNADLTATDAVRGSPLYMSPEQMRSSKRVDARTDIWAIGVVLYKLLTGVTPFEASSMTAVVSRVLQTEPRPPSVHRQDIPEWVDIAILQCLRKRPGDRFQKIDDLMVVLRQTAPPAVSKAESNGDASLSSPPLCEEPKPSSAPEIHVEETAMNPIADGTGISADTSTTTGSFGQVSNLKRAFHPEMLPARMPKSRVALWGLGFAILVGASLIIGFRLSIRSRPEGETITVSTAIAASAGINHLEALPEPVEERNSVTEHSLPTVSQERNLVTSEASSAPSQSVPDRMKNQPLVQAFPYVADESKHLPKTAIIPEVLPSPASEAASPMASQSAAPNTSVPPSEPSVGTSSPVTSSPPSELPRPEEPKPSPKKKYDSMF